MTDFWKDNELQAEGMRVAGEFHADKCASARFLFIFRDPPKKSGSTIAAGTASKISKQNKDIGMVDADYLITIAKKVWDEMDNDERVALLDHELSHCLPEVQEDGEIKYKLRPHDIEDFVEIYERHGAWQENLNKLKNVILRDNDGS